MYGLTVILIFLFRIPAVYIRGSIRVFFSHHHYRNLTQLAPVRSRQLPRTGSLLKTTLAAGLSHLAQLRSRLLTCKPTFARYRLVCSPFSEIKPELEVCLINREVVTVTQEPCGHFLVKPVLFHPTKATARSCPGVRR